MRNLLSANFLRLRKSILFWLPVLGMLAYGLFSALSIVRSAKANPVGWPSGFGFDFLCFRYVLPLGLVLAAFTGLFFGAEHSDGGLRRKLSTGRLRGSVYAADLLTSFGMCLALCAAYLLPVLTLVPLLAGGRLRMGAGPFLLTLLATLAMGAAFCSCFLLVYMNCANKAAACAVCLGLVGCLLFFSSNIIGDALRQSEYLLTMVENEAGEFVEGGQVPNPLYPAEWKRAVYWFLYNVLPTGQTAQYMDTLILYGTLDGIQEPAKLPLYALTVAAVSTAAGLLLFRKKDLK